jgi:hypothetical protein
MLIMCIQQCKRVPEEEAEEACGERKLELTRYIIGEHHVRKILYQHVKEVNLFK